MNRNNDAVPNISKRLVETAPLEGVRFISVKTALADAVIIHGSILGGDSYAPKNNPALPSLVAATLDEGTEHRSKQEIRETLESIGASIEFSTNRDRIEFSAQCMKKDLETVIALLAGQLREPAFPKRDVAIAKHRMESELDELFEDTKYRAETRFLQCLYPKNHPNYRYDAPFIKKCIDKTTHTDLRDFHRSCVGRSGMYLVAAGDVDADTLARHVKKYFADVAPKNLEIPSYDPVTSGKQARTEILPVADKASADFYTGNTIAITKAHPDFYPLSLGLSVLGGTFFARLMNTVREEKGLTYRVRAGISGADMRRTGHWYIFAMFAPQLLAQGEEAVRYEVEQFVTRGITAAELRMHQETIAGSFKVSLASAESTALAILANAEEGRGHAFLDGYVDMINNIALTDVNAAIQKHMRTDNLVTVIAGSIDKTKKPLA